MITSPRQCFQKEEMDSLGGSVSVIDVTSDSCDGIPVFLACGWSETLGMLENTIFIISKIINRRILSLDYSRLDDTHVADKRFPANDYLKARALISLIEKKNIDKVDVIAHSEGAIIVTIAAYLKPKKFRKILFIAPAGFLPYDNFYYLVFRFLKDTLYELSFSFQQKTFFAYVKYLKHSLIYIFRNPIQSAKEAFGISKFKITPLLREIQDKGVDIAVIQHKEDVIFPTKKTQKIIEKTTIKNFYLAEGGHNDIHSNPEKFANMILNNGYF